jgi:hypothetical protein
VRGHRASLLVMTPDTASLCSLSDRTATASSGVQRAKAVLRDRIVFVAIGRGVTDLRPVTCVLLRKSHERY